MIQNCLARLFCSNRVVMNLSGCTIRQLSKDSCSPCADSATRLLQLVVLPCPHMASPHGSSGRESWKMAHWLLTLLLVIMSTHSPLSRTGHRASPNRKWGGKCEKLFEYLVISKWLQALWNQDLVVRN